MKIIQTLLFLIFTSCANSPLRIYTSTSKESVFHQDGLWKLSGEKVEVFLESQNDLAARALLKCHKKESKVGLGIINEHFTKLSSNDDIWNVRAVCHILAKEYDEALLAVDRGLLSIKNNESLKIKLLHNKALIFHKIEHFIEAQMLYKEVLKLSPGLYSTQFNLGLLYLQYNLLSDAKSYLIPLLKVAPNDIDLLSSIGLSFALDGQYIKSIQYFEQIPSEKRKREDIALYYSLALIGSKRYEQAKIVLKDQDVPFISGIRQMSRGLQKMVEEHLKTVAAK